MSLPYHVFDFFVTDVATPAETATQSALIGGGTVTKLVITKVWHE